MIIVKHGKCEIFSLNSKISKILSLVMKITEVVTSLIFTAEVELNYKINNKSEKYVNLLHLILVKYPTKETT